MVAILKLFSGFDVGCIIVNGMRFCIDYQISFKLDHLWWNYDVVAIFKMVAVSVWYNDRPYTKCILTLPV